MIALFFLKLSTFKSSYLFWILAVLLNNFYQYYSFCNGSSLLIEIHRLKNRTSNLLIKETFKLNFFAINHLVAPLYIFKS